MTKRKWAWQYTVLGKHCYWMNFLLRGRVWSLVLILWSSLRFCIFQASYKINNININTISRYIPQRQEKMTKKKKKKYKSTTHVNTISKFLYHTILHNNVINPPESNVIVRLIVYSKTFLLSRQKTFDFLLNQKCLFFKLFPLKTSI